MQYTALYISPLGEMTLVSDGEALTELIFEGQKALSLNPERMGQELPVFRQTREWLDIYFSGEAPNFTPPLQWTGSRFQKEVWTILTAIPYGKTRTYGDIAQEIAHRRGISRMSAQAIGGAVARNPISIIVPCHRVVGKSGNLTGYAGGIQKKVALLKLENAWRDKFFVPAHRASPA